MAPALKNYIKTQAHKMMSCNKRGNKTLKYERLQGNMGE